MPGILPGRGAVFKGLRTVAGGTEAAVFAALQIITRDHWHVSQKGLRWRHCVACVTENLYTMLNFDPTISMNFPALCTQSRPGLFLNRS